MRLQLSFSGCVLRIFVIFWASLSTMLSAIAMYHLKHCLSTFLMFKTASFLLMNCGSSIQELPFNGLYSTRRISRDVTLWNLQLLSLWLKFWIISWTVFMEVSNSSDSVVASRFTITMLWKWGFRSSTLSSNYSSLTISQFKIIVTFVLRFSLISFKTSGFALCINSRGPKPAIPSILKCLAKPLNELAVWLIQTWMLFLLISLISLIFLSRSTFSGPNTLIIFDSPPVYFSIRAFPQFLWFPFSVYFNLRTDRHISCLW